MPTSRLLRRMLERYLFENDNTDYLVVIIARYYYPNEVSMIKKGICPWCLKRFKSLRAHFKHKKCGFMFKMLLDNVMRIYFDFKNSVYYRYSKEDHSSYVVLKGVVKCKSMKEALKQYLILKV